MKPVLTAQPADLCDLLYPFPPRGGTPAERGSDTAREVKGRCRMCLSNVKEQDGWIVATVAESTCFYKPKNLKSFFFFFKPVQQMCLHEVTDEDKRRPFPKTSMITRSTMETTTLISFSKVGRMGIPAGDNFISAQRRDKPVDLSIYCRISANIGGCVVSSIIAH